MKIQVLGPQLPASTDIDLQDVIYSKENHTEKIIQKKNIEHYFENNFFTVCVVFPTIKRVMPVKEICGL